jgi:hypothetical protein
MQSPAINDSEYVLIYKLSHNLWEAAGEDASGIAEPIYGQDTVQNLLKKAVSASALL